MSRQLSLCHKPREWSKGSLRNETQSSPQAVYPSLGRENRWGQGPSPGIHCCQWYVKMQWCWSRKIHLPCYWELGILPGRSGCQLMRRRGTQRSLHLLTMWGLSPALTLRLKRLWNGRISLASFTFPKKKLLLCGLLFANKQATLLIDHTNSQKTCSLLYHVCVDPLICL